jgi:hypothetical protein
VPDRLRIPGLLIERVQLHEDRLDIVWRDGSWQKFRRELVEQPFVIEQRARVVEVGGRSEVVVA